MLLRYIIILLLLYVLYRLVKTALRDFTANLNARRKHAGADGKNVRGGGKANLDDIPDAKYEEIKDDPEDRKN